MVGFSKYYKLSLLNKYYFGRSLPYSRGSLLNILIDCMIFLSPFLGVTRKSMSTISFLAQLEPEILCV